MRDGQAAVVILVGCGSSGQVKAQLVKCETIRENSFAVREPRPTADCPNCYVIVDGREAELDFSILTSNSGSTPKVLSLELPGFGSKLMEAPPGDTLQSWTVTTREAPGNGGCEALDAAIRTLSVELVEVS